MNLLEVLFWTCVAAILYPYLVYPLALRIFVKLLGERPVRRVDGHRPSVSIVLTAYNEEAAIPGRLREFASLLHTSKVLGEILVVSDGSTDRTAEVAAAVPDDRIQILTLPDNIGKAAALTAGCQAAGNEILVFADARQHWAPDALTRLLENFADPEIGAVSGALHVETPSGALAGVGLYWRFEKWLRWRESQFHSAVGVSGSISAMRRALFRPIPPGTILDDVYQPLRTAMQGFRVIHDDNARAYDRLPEKARDELRRKVRTLSGNFQLLTRLPAALLPWRNPICWQFVSHKLARLLVPWALLGVLVCSILLDGWPYRMAFWTQIGFYFLGLAGLGTVVGPRFRLASAAASFLVLNTAAWLAFWVWILGRTSTSWKKVTYQNIMPNPSKNL